MIVSPCNAAKMSAKRMRSALVAGSALLCLLSAGQLWAFNLDDVSAKAKELAGQKFEAPRSNLPRECFWRIVAKRAVLAAGALERPVVFPGNDRPGIVRDITRLLAEQGVNLESLTTEVAPAPMSSEPLFHAEAILAVPLTLSLDVLQSRLETLADDLMVELVLRSEP